MIGRRARAATAVAGASAALLVLSGCGNPAGSTAIQTPIPVESAWHPALFAQGHPGQGLGPEVTPSPSAASGSPSPADTTLDDAVQQRLSEVGLQPADASGLTVALATDGTALNQPSLPYCDKTFPAEKSREARRRLEVRDSAGKRIGISSEAVLFTTSAGATEALRQLSAAASACASPRTVTSNDRTYVVVQRTSTDVPVSGLVDPKQRVLLSTVVTEKAADGTSVTYRIQRIWQQRGRLLVGLIVESGGTDFTPAELTAIGRLASAVATRMGQVDGTLTGAS